MEQETKESNNYLIHVDDYLVKHAEQKVRDANNGKLVTPILFDNHHIYKKEE